MTGSSEGRSPLAVSQVIEEGSVPTDSRATRPPCCWPTTKIQALIDNDALEVNSMNRIQKEINDFLLK